MLLMGKSTISMAIFNSYFDITRGYVITTMVPVNPHFTLVVQQVQHCRCEPHPLDPYQCEARMWVVNDARNDGEDMLKYVKIIYIYSYAIVLW